MTDREHLYTEKVKHAIDYGLPSHLAHSLAGYLVHRSAVGDCLHAILSNNLMRAYAHADGETIERMNTIVKYLYNRVPGVAWGSPANVDAWLAQKGDSDDV